MKLQVKTAVAISFCAFSAFGASPAGREAIVGSPIQSFVKQSGTTIDHFVRQSDGVTALAAVEYEGLYLPAAKAERHGRSVIISVPGLPPVTLTESDGPQRLTVSTETSTLGRWFFTGNEASRVEFATAAMDAAADKLASAQCRTVFTNFKNADGKTLQEVLDGYGVSATTYLTSWAQFNNGSNNSLCTSSGSSFPIYTSPGSRSIWVCSQFVTVQRSTPGYAAVLMIHEELHSLGLRENPPSSAEITNAVQDACGN